MSDPKTDLTLDDQAPCPGCSQPIGQHTITGYKECLEKAGFDYVLPYEEIPGGPIYFPAGEGSLVGEVSVGAGFLPTAMGVMPVLRFVFTGPGALPMERRSLPPINLVMDANGLRSVRTLIGTSIDEAILEARRRR